MEEGDKKKEEVNKKRDTKGRERQKEEGDKRSGI